MEQRCLPLCSIPGQVVGTDSGYQTDETFTYDASGNRTMSGYSTGDNNQLLSDGTSNYDYEPEPERQTSPAALTLIIHGTTATG